MSKGQISVFIVLGLVILITAGIAIYIINVSNDVSDGEAVLEGPYEVRPIQEYVQNCLSDVATNAVYIAGSRGGRVYQLTDYLDVGYSNVSYYYDYGEDRSPSLDEIEVHLASFVEDNIEKCTGNLTFFDDLGFDISTLGVDANATIVWGAVMFTVEYPLLISKDDSDYRLLEWAVRVDIPLGKAYNISQEILAMELMEPEYVDLTALSNFGVNVTLIPYDEENILYSIEMEDEFVYLFANRFEYNNPPELNILDRLEASDGERFVYQVLATDADSDTLNFYDDTAMFDISSDGVIDFVPHVTGVFDVTITVRDGKGKYDEKKLEVVIS